MKLNDGTEIQFIGKPEWRNDWSCAIKIIRPDGQQWGITFDEESYIEFTRHLMLFPIVAYKENDK